MGSSGHRRLPRGPGARGSRLPSGHCIVPPYLLQEIAQNRPEDAAWVLQMLAHDEQVRLGRTAVPAPATGGPAWVVHTAHSGSSLPGEVVRTAGDGPSGDAAVDEAA